MTTSEAITMMPVTAGVFCWNELATRDVGASCKFYTALFGWNAETNEVDGTPYTMFYSNGHPVGGCLAIDENWPADMPSCWGSYIAVDDVAAAVKRAEECGGSLCFGPLTVTDVGEFAGLVDPSGAVISVFNGGDGENPVGNGAFCWNELSTSEPERAAQFYCQVFGWTTESSTSTDEPYTLFNCGQTQVGGMAELQNPEVPSHWMGYIAVADVDAATGAAKALGASVYCPPTDIPGIGRFTTLGGPCGATFAVFTTSHGCGCDG